MAGDNLVEINSASKMLGSSHFYFSWLAISTIPKTSKFFIDNLDMDQLNSFLAIKRKKKNVILENTLGMRMLLYILGNWAQFHLF